jgi:chemotaxis protein methyltransferase CheR
MTMNAADAGFIRSMVLSESAIVLDASKGYLIESRLAPLVRETGTGTLEGFVAKLRAAPTGPLRTRVIEAITTNETNFFRDIYPWQALREVVIPRLLAARATTRSLTIWCAAASSGQEPYSLAMTLVDRFPELSSWKVKIVASDISAEILARAKEGRYSQLEVNRGLSAPVLAKHFERDGAGWVIKKRLRDMIDFRKLNLVRPWIGLGASDLVMMRNVLIYFDVPTKAKVLHQVGKQLKPDGALFLGGAETTLNLANEFERVQHGKSSWYRLKEGQP